MAVGIFAATLAASTAHAGPGWTDMQKADGTPGRIQVYTANSPSGSRLNVPAEAVGYDNVVGSGKAMRKFVDPLPLIGEANAKKMADGATSKYIPKAVAEKWVDPSGKVTADDYYELAVIEYSDRFHSDLKKASTLRGYVQLSTAANPGKAIALTYPDGTPIMIQATDANGKLLFDAVGAPVKVQAKAVDNPHYLGPVIAATKGVATRVKFHNLLPVGRAEQLFDANGLLAGVKLDANGNPLRHGDLFLPVDPSITGAGTGPDGFTKYSQNRVAVHLQGSDAPWISDGSALQWFTPADEADAGVTGSLAAEGIDPALLPQFLRGASAVNVPDMNEPGAGAYTFYYPNQQSARLLWLQDQAEGLARLNDYAGMVALYTLSDPTELDLVARGIIPSEADTIPLVLQDKTFVPDDIALQDSRWNTSAWGTPGDLWTPHVYESIQDPNQFSGLSPSGRWNYGPLYWPVFPALYTLPSGAYGDETYTPDAWGDTPVINGVAFPVMTVEPKAYRLRLLNASVDRMLTFNLFVADTSRPAAFDPNNFSEVAMVPAVLPANACPAADTRSTVINGTACTPASWPVDGRKGGVPNPATQGPTLYQIGNEGGLLPVVAPIDPAPTVQLYDVGRVTVLNIDTSGLFLAPSERADVVVDFSTYAGQTLIAYNDMNSPVPSGDPRNDYYTGGDDLSSSGGVESVQVGYGPNSRTLMQFKVAPAVTTAGIAFDPAVLTAEIPKAYAASQNRPVVAQAAYNDAYGTSWTDSYASIYTGSLKEPTFKFTPGTPTAFGGVSVTAGGSNYVTPPVVTISGGGATTAATAVATLKINALPVSNAGNGYTIAPLVRITAQAGGGYGATANATLKATSVVVTNGGSGYTTAPTITFSKPQTPGGIQATGTATVSAGKVTKITITNAGSGYTAAPTVTIALPVTGTRAAATTYGGVSALTLTAADPANPSTKGGGGYTDLSQVTVTIDPPQGTVAPVTAAASALGTVYDVTLVTPGAGYSALPSISFAGGGGSGATATGLASSSSLVKTKTVQELFDPTYGRYNYTLGMELPFTTGTTQTTIPLGFIDPATESIADGETQIWKITVNGLFTQPVMLHVGGEVQVINRVGWDSFVSPPAANELGWKETVRVNPLEDTIIAVRAKRAVTPGWGVPLSQRLNDPTQPAGSPFGFTQVDVVTGMAAVVTNQMQNYGWEYAWQNSQQSHTASDFMRPVIFSAGEAAPTTPGTPVGVVGGSVTAPTVALTWADAAVTEYKYEVQRADNNGAFVTVASLPANSTSYTDQVAPNSAYQYRVVAIGAAGASISAASATVAVGLTVPATPTSLNVVSTTASSVSLSWVDAATNESGYVLTRSGGNGGSVTINLGANVTNYVDTTVAAGTAYSYTLVATNAAGNSASITTTTTTPSAALAAPTGVTATRGAVGSRTVTVAWGSVTGAAKYTVQYRRQGTTAWTPLSNITTLSKAVTGLTAGTTYQFSVIAVNAAGTASKASATVTATAR